MSGSPFPTNRTFAFTVFDDTDNSTIANTRPVYDFLQELGLLTTKSVWVEPPRGPSSGSCLKDDAYREWVCQLQAAGFEIGFHGVGDGDFSREEILAGVDYFREVLGHYPEVYANHQSNSHNVYWWNRRFSWPFNWLYSIVTGMRGRGFSHGGGHIEGSELFWGDVLKKHVKYIRNFTFNAVNTLDCDPQMPYLRRDTKFANYWFSSSDGHTVEEFNGLVSPDNIDRLEQQGGACIVYTHFASGFVDDCGELNPVFRSRMEQLADRNGWFVPTGILLDHLLARHAGGESTSSASYQRRLAMRWGADRLLKRLRYGR